MDAYVDTDIMPYALFTVFKTNQENRREPYKEETNLSFIIIYSNNFRTIQTKII